VWKEYKKLGADDTTAKGTDFVANIVQLLKEPAEETHNIQI
jgi:hypothetical protein